MRQWRVEVVDLVGCVVYEFLGRVVVDGAHQPQTVDNHDDNHADILGKGQQQFAEVLALDRRAAAIERAHLVEAAYHLGYVVAPFLGKRGLAGVGAYCRQYHGKAHVAVGTEAVADAHCRVEGRYQGVQTEAVARHAVGRCVLFYGCLDAVDIVWRDLPVEGRHKPAVVAQRCLYFFVCQIMLFHV